jgi:tRNA threonylcarbamoyladenosine biosynthesis protein TsaE
MPYERSKTYKASNEEEMVELGREFARMWPRVGVVLLIGNLGAGKTTLAKGIVEGLGVERADNVSSPTFPLIHEYGDPVEVYHIDLYRLDTRAEVESLGLEEIFERPAMVLMEWAERFPEILPNERIEVRIQEEKDGGRAVECRSLS